MTINYKEEAEFYTVGKAKWQVRIDDLDAEGRVLAEDVFTLALRMLFIYPGDYIGYDREVGLILSAPECLDEDTEILSLQEFKDYINSIHENDTFTPHNID